MKFLKNIKNLVEIFIKAKKKYLLPVHKNIIIYQESNHVIFKKYFYTKDILILDKNRSLNIPVLIMTLIFCIWYRSWVPYYRLFIKLSKAKCVITFMHNDSDFYQLKLDDSKVYISIQNGVILGTQKWVEQDRIYKSDYFLCFGIDTQLEFQKKIDTKFKHIGSFKNNIYSTNKLKEKENYLTFFSQYKLNRSIKNFFAIEKKMMPYLNSYCKQNKLKLRICGSSVLFSSDEKKYYQDIIKDDFIFLPRRNIDSSYKHLGESKINVSIDSTIGLESLACGHKTAIFMVRSKRLKLNNWHFGKNIEEISDDGPFWCTEDKISEYDRVLNYLKDIDIGTWYKDNNELISKIIEYDKDNSILKEILTSHEVPHRSRV